MSVYYDITASIIDSIEEGSSEFRMPWHRSASGGRPKNATTNATYNGINTLNLWMAQQSRGFASEKWATFKQWSAAGHSVRKGSKGSLVVFYKPLHADPDTGERKFVLKSSTVFNADQIEGFVPDTFNGNAHALETPEQFIADVGVDVRHGGQQAFYDRASDYVQLPPRQAFFDTDGYYSVLLHETAHWTGHPARLAREYGKRFGDNAYAFEELVAELSAAFLCADLGVCNTPRPDHAAYIGNWLSVLKQDSRAIFAAASAAQKACEYLHEVKFRSLERQLQSALSAVA